MKKQWIIFALALMAGQAHALRIAYVDIAKVFDRYDGTAKAKEELKGKAEGEKAKLEKDQEKLRKKLDDLQAKKKALTEENYAKQEQVTMKEIQELQKRISTVQNDLIGQEKQLTGQILEEIREVVKKVADKEKYDYVLELNALLYGGTEITATVIRELNDKK